MATLLSVFVVEPLMLPGSSSPSSPWWMACCLFWLRSHGAQCEGSPHPSFPPSRLSWEPSAQTQSTAPSCTMTQPSVWVKGPYLQLTTSRPNKSNPNSLAKQFKKCFPSYKYKDCLSFSVARSHIHTHTWSSAHSLTKNQFCSQQTMQYKQLLAQCSDIMN